MKISELASPTEFHSHDKRFPCLIHGFFTIPQVLWSFHTFATDQEIEVHIGNMETGSTHLEYIPLSEYIKEVLSGQTNRYAAQLDFDALFPSLRDDLNLKELFPPHYKLWAYLWIGGAGSVTGLHRDDSDNLFIQVEGQKQVTLVPSDTRRDRIYESKKWDAGAVMSLVDAENPDLEKFPLFDGCRRVKVVVDEHEVLFIPRGWWHQVRSLTPAITISCFAESAFKDPFCIISKSVALLHRLGITGRHGCTCHSGK